MSWQNLGDSHIWITVADSYILIPTFWLADSYISIGWFPHYDWLIPTVWLDDDSQIFIPTFWLADSYILIGWFPHFNSHILIGWFLHFDWLIPTFLFPLWLADSYSLIGWFPNFHSHILIGWFLYFDWMIPTFSFPHFDWLIFTFWLADSYIFILFIYNGHRSRLFKIPNIFLYGLPNLHGNYMFFLYYFLLFCCLERWQTKNVKGSLLRWWIMQSKNTLFLKGIWNEKFGLK